MFMIPALTALGGGSAVAGGIIAAGTAASAYGAIKGANAAGKAQSVGNNSDIDIAALDDQTRAIAKQNAADAAALEAKMTPEVPQLRTAANQAVLGGLGGNANQGALANFVMSRFGKPITGGGTLNTPLLNEAIAKARSDLALGGQLSLDQRNEATRRGAADAMGATGHLGLGRDLSARDLGLTSYGVEQQRLANATNLAPQEFGRENTMLNYGFNSDLANNQNYLSQFGALNSYYNNLRQQDLAAAAYGQSIQQPVVGLDPSAVGNLTVANKNNQTIAAMNAANIKAQTGQNLMGFGGQLLGYGSSFFGGGGAAAGAGGVSSVGLGLSGAAAGMCWIARECYGKDNPAWLEFRDWLTRDASPEFRNFYQEHGEDIASQIKDDPLLKELIRHLMNSAKLN